MQNHVYCGKITVPKYKDEEMQIVQGLHQPLISEHLFYEIQDVMDGRKRQQGTKLVSLDQLPLRGYLLWSRCNRVLTGSASKDVNSIIITITAHPNAAADTRQKK